MLAGVILVRAASSSRERYTEEIAHHAPPTSAALAMTITATAIAIRARRDSGGNQRRRGRFLDAHPAPSFRLIALHPVER